MWFAPDSLDPAPPPTVARADGGADLDPAIIVANNLANKAT
jgi:hypothetical protein